MSMADRIAVMDSGRVQQVADPVTLYGQPANLFVADFIGSGTLIPGVIDGGGLRSLGRLLPIANDRGLAGEAVLMLRPEQVQGVDEGEPALLEGEVVETHFYGGSSTTSIRGAGLEYPVIASRPGAPAHLVGEQVGITWEASASVLLAAGP